MIKAVLDTNVYVSAFLRPDKPIHRLWLQAVQRRYCLLISPPMVKEVARIMRTRFFWNEKRLIARLKKMIRVAKLIVPTIVIDAVESDPDDNRILECAVEGQADMIVSGDGDLLRLKSYRGIPIVTPMDFLRTLGIAGT